MGNLLHSLEVPALLFVAVFVVAFLYYWLWLLHPQSIGVRHFQEKRYPEAAEAFQKVLKRRPPPGIEADTRRRLADTLDVLGRAEEAAAERERASTVAMTAATDPMALIAQGDLLKRQHHYDEACMMYETALSLLPVMGASGRAQIMAKLTIAHYEAGRSVEALRWAKAALASSPAQDIRRMMESMAGVASADQGDLNGAEDYYRKALGLARSIGKPEEVSRTMAILAGIQYKRGQFMEAITSSREARQICADPSRTSFAIEAECLREMGRFDEARAVMAQRRLAPGFDQPWTERRMQALGALGAAWVETRADQPEAALAFLEQAHEGFVANASTGRVWPPSPQGSDDKLILWCDATKSLALAQRGDIGAARQMRESVLSRLPRFIQDRATQLGAYGHLGRAAFVTGEFDECKKLFHHYLDCQPNPVGLPSAYYWLGEAHLRLAEVNAAREAFRQALAPGIDSLEARRAQARLDEFGG
jgi:tetratricopeptide (TPR) repeat protein